MRQTNFIIKPFIRTALPVLLILGLMSIGYSGLKVVSLAISTQASSPTATLLFDIGMHIEPLGAVPSAIVGGRPSQPGQGASGPDYNNRTFFERQIEDIETVIGIVEKHGGRLTVQAQTPFTTSAASFGNTILADLEARGHEIGLHFHEDAHLGRNPEGLPVATWCAVMKEEIGFIHQAGVVNHARYWSGGNLYPGVLDAASCAGLDVNSDWKNPHTQQTDELLIGINPWRPASGPTENNVSGFARHDPQGKVIFLPEGLYDRTDFASMRRSETSGGDQAYFDFLKESLERSLKAAQPDRINVFHFTVHPGEFRGDPKAPFAVIDRFLTDAVDPLVAAGKVRWATFSQMADAFAEWERTHPGVNPRSTATTAVASPVTRAIASQPASAAATPTAYMTFALNVHDFRHIDESADTILRLISLFQKYGVKGDFYLTGPMVQLYAEKRPDVISHLRDSSMAISYHVRPPHPLYPGFDQRLRNLDSQTLASTLHDYETYQLGLATGGLRRDQPGGYTYVAQTLGRAPVTISAPNNDSRIKAAAHKLFADLGAQMTVIYHETGTDLNEPFEYREGLLVRPSDFSITRWAVDNKAEAFWWNMLDTPLAADYAPTTYLQKELAAWQGPRPPFITSLIHENNFYRSGPESWTLVYYADKDKTQPLAPPFDLNAPDPSQPRPSGNQEAIWAAYEQLVAYAAANLRVVTSEDIVKLAGTVHRSSTASPDKITVVLNQSPIVRATATDATVTLTLGADLSDTPIRPLLGVNAGPTPAGEPGNADLTARYQQAGVTLVRTHDYYGPLDMATIYPDQNVDPANPSSYNFTTSDQTFAAIINGGFEPYLRLGDSYNDVRPITNPSNWVRAAVEVVHHYNDPTRWGASHLHYIEIWNEPDNAHFWLGTRSDFFALFTQAARALKATFPTLKIGGPGLTPAGFKSPQGQNFTRAFLEYIRANGVPLDFFSWHMYSNDPVDFTNGAHFYRGLLDNNGYTATESHISEWNTEFREGRGTDATVRTGAKGAALMSAAWIGLQEQNVAASTFYRGNDPSINAPTWYGIFYADGRPKPVGLAFSLWSQMAAHPLRRDVSMSSTSGLQALVGHNRTGEFTFLIVNPTNTLISWQIGGLSTNTQYTITLQQISDPATEIQTSTLPELRSQIAAYTTQLVTVTPTSAAVSRVPTIAAQPQPPPGSQGPFFHQIYSASSSDGLNWTLDNRLLIDHASVPAAIATPDGKIRIYYVDASTPPETTNCAESSDRGLTFNVLGCTITNRAGEKALDPSIVRLPDGRYRLYYYASSTDPGKPGTHSIYSAISDDGIHFTTEKEVFSYPGLVDPDVFWNGEAWLMFVFSGNDGTTIVARSRDGLSFEYVGALGLPGWGTTAPVKLDDGRFRLYAFDQRTSQTVASFISPDGLTWAQEPGVRLTAPVGQRITDPFVVRLPDGTWKMVYKTERANATTLSNDLAETVICSTG